jgi:hypothetical protein
MARTLFPVLLCVLAVVLPAAKWLGGAEPASKAPPAEATERARKTVRMLDDVYKTAVVLITDKYVNSDKDFPAGSAAIALFSEIQKKGWHEVRLIDVSGEPYDPKNVADDAFEKQAVGQLKAGKTYVEEVGEKGGKPVLRAMTAIPVVMKKCTMCHPNYEKAKPGEAVGAISYTLPIE